MTFIEKIEKLPKFDLAGKDYKEKEIKRKDIGFILAKLVKDYSLLYDGPTQARMNREKKRLPNFASLIDAVNEVGVHSMIVGRASRELGLVRNIETIEPGAKLTGKSSDINKNIDRTKS